MGTSKNKPSGNLDESCSVSSYQWLFMLMVWTIKLLELCCIASNPPYIIQCNSFRSSIITRVNIHIHLYWIWVNVKSSCYSLLRGVWLQSSILSWNKRLLLNQAYVPFHSTLHTIFNNPCLQLCEASVIIYQDHAITLYQFPSALPD